MKRKIQIVGAGAVGSRFLLYLLRNDPFEYTIKISDFDKVELKNAHNQIYLPSHEGRYKVDVLKEIANEFGYNLRTSIEKVVKPDDDTDILVLAVDNLESRYQIAKDFDGWIIDTRITENAGLCYSILNAKERYLLELEESIEEDRKELERNPGCRDETVAPNHVDIICGLSFNHFVQKELDVKAAVMIQEKIITLKNKML